MMVHSSRMRGARPCPAWAEIIRLFSIGGEGDNELIITDGVIFFADQSVYEVELTVNDFYGESVTGTFTITVSAILF